MKEGPGADMGLESHVDPRVGKPVRYERGRGGMRWAYLLLAGYLALAGLETGDTAGSEACATGLLRFAE